MRLRLMAATLLLFFGVGVYKVLRRFPDPWARVLVGGNAPDESTKSRIHHGLRGIEKSSNVRPGAVLPLVEFATASGATTRLTLIEGYFQASGIAPDSTWTRLGPHVMLVNSVDQTEEPSQGVSRGIGTGCGPRAAGRIPLNLGDVSLHPCAGPYNKRDHVAWVANLAIIVLNNPDSDKRPCGAYGETGETYQQCVAQVVATALRNLFKELHSHPNIRIDSLIFPAVGTGKGQLRKDTFYQLLFSQLFKELAYSGSLYQLPPTIYIQTWVGDRTKWGPTKNAIASSLTDLVTDWNDTDHKTDAADWAAFVGIAGGLALLLLCASVGRSLPLLGKDAAVLAAGPSIALFIGWFSASLGLVTALKSVIALLPSKFDPWPQILIGCSVALGCGPLLRAVQRFDSEVRPPHVEVMQAIETRYSSREVSSSDPSYGSLQSKTAPTAEDA